MSVIASKGLRQRAEDTRSNPPPATGPKEKLERKHDLRAVIEVDDRPQYFKYVLEAHHMREEANIKVYPLMRLTHPT